MKRRVALLAGAGGVAALAAGFGLVAAFRGGRTGVPTVRVVSAPFVRKVTAEGNLRAASATPVTAPIEAESSLKIAWLVAEGTVLRKGDPVVRFDPTDLRKELEDGELERRSADTKLGKADARSATTREALEADVEKGKRELDVAGALDSGDSEIFSRNERLDQSLDRELAETRLDSARSVRQVRGRLAAAERGLLEIERKKVDLRLGRANRGLSALEVLSPGDGIFVLQRDWRGEVKKVGDTVWPGENLGEIPGLAKLEAEVFVLEADAGGLAISQAATVSVESRATTPLSGKVRRVDTLARPRFRNVPVQYFGATIELDRTDPSFMKPGQRIRAEIVLENRVAAIVVPRQAVFERSGRKVVFLRRGRGFEEVPVSVSPASAGRLLVTAGLVAPAELALVDPAPPVPSAEGAG